MERGRRREEAPETGKRRGEVKWFNVQKGYGFIREPDGQEIFFHRSSLLSASPWEVFEGQAVRFEEEETARGPQAVAVELID
ncbi:MAG: cold-shock protein [Anaerolineae bacterium]